MSMRDRMTEKLVPATFAIALEMAVFATYSLEHFSLSIVLYFTLFLFVYFKPFVWAGTSFLRWGPDEHTHPVAPVFQVTEDFDVCADDWLRRVQVQGQGLPWGNSLVLVVSNETDSGSFYQHRVGVIGLYPECDLLGLGWDDDEFVRFNSVWKWRGTGLSVWKSKC